MIRFLTYSILLLSALLACQQKPAPADQTPAENQSPATAGLIRPGSPDVIELTADQMRLGGVATGPVSYRALSQVVTVNGRLAVPAGSQVSITALQGGFVRSLPLLPGQRVRKGQVLARIENLDLIQVQQDYAETQSRLTYLEAEYSRQQELSAQNASALKVLQQTTADRSAAQARLQGLAQRLRLVGISPRTALQGSFTSYYLVTAPVTGVVTNVLANRGQFVQPADVVAQLTSSEGLYAELTVFEKDLAGLAEGQRVRLQLTTEPGRQRSARVQLINRAIDADRSVRVVARLDAADARLAPNTFLEASIDLGSRRVTALPEDAIVRAGDKEYIFLVIPDPTPERVGPNNTGPLTQTFRAIPVQRGVTEKGYSQVMLPESFSVEQSRVVVRGAYAVWAQLNGGGDDE